MSTARPKSKDDMILHSSLCARLNEFRELAASRNIKTIEQREALVLIIRLIETLVGATSLTERTPTHHV